MRSLPYSWEQHGANMWSLVQHPLQVPAIARVRRFYDLGTHSFHVQVGSPKVTIAAFPTLNEAKAYAETYATLAVDE